MKPKTCIRITGTRSGKLRARVEQKNQPRFEVTIGGEKWSTLDVELRHIIMERARHYVNHLDAQVVHEIEELME